jgi:enoyl-CoA hydratase
MRRLLELTGPAVAKELLFTGEVVHGARARELGLLNRTVPGHDLWTAARSLADAIAANAPLSVRHTKTIFRRFLAAAPLEPEVLSEVARLRDECFRSPDFLERSRKLGERKG